MKHIPGDLNRSLWGLLNLDVRTGGTFAPDGTWLRLYVRDAEGRASAPPDCEHDVSEVIQRLPPGVEIRLKYSPQVEQWRCDLLRGCEIYEQFADTDALAASLALEQMLIADRAGVT